jgi:hypothetical protein
MVFCPQSTRCKIRGGRGSPPLAARYWGEKDKKVYSNGRTGQRDYSCHCEEAKNLKILPQGSERDFVSSESIKICSGGEKAALQYSE